jgi:hypothetical protein
LAPHGRWHQTREQRYRYVLSTLGIPPDSKKIVFVEGNPDWEAADQLVVDWTKFVAGRERQGR